MADVKISGLPASTTPLAGTEVLPIVQGGQTRQVSVADLTAGRAVTATSINKMAITAPATSSTLAVADGKTLTASNSLTLAGTDATTMTFPTTSATIARTDAAQTFTGLQTFGALTTTGNVILGDATTDTLNVGNGGLIKDASGNVGVGTASPTTKIMAYNGSSRTLIRAASDLNFSGAYLGTATASNRGASVELLTHANGTDAGGWKQQVAVDVSGYDLTFSYSGASSTYAGLSYSEKMRLHASGGVSIGNTTDPGATNLSVTGTASAASFIPTSSSAPTNGLYLPAANIVGLATNGSERMRIDATGNFQLGTSANDLTLQIGPNTPANTRSSRVAFTTSSTQKSWFIANNWNVAGGLEFTQSTAAGGTTMSATSSMSLDASGNLSVANTGTFGGIIKPQQATTAAAPAYVKGAIYFDTTLNKLRVGGATAWETITST